jgi:hypothetical protein
MNYFYSVLILLLLSCNTSIHQYNLDTQCKRMLQFDQKSRNEQQKIRDSRKKRVKVYKKRLLIK